MNNKHFTQQYFYNSLKLNLPNFSRAIQIIVCFLFSSLQIFSESVTTNLTKEEHIKIFHEVTSQIRCICLPSLPIKSCSFNNCEVSALLKEFIEHRIEKGEDSKTIINKMLNGFGEDALQDPIIQKFQAAGNTAMVQGVVYGFGEKILAEPDSRWINLTLFGLIFLGFGLLYLYSKKVQKTKREETILSSRVSKYLKEIE